MIDTTIITLENGQKVSVGYQYTRNGFGTITGLMVINVYMQGGILVTDKCLQNEAAKKAEKKLL
jgi:hypothetical protein